MSDPQSALLFAGGFIPQTTPQEPPASLQLDGRRFLENASALFPQLRLPKNVSQEAFSSAFSESIFQLHQSIMYDTSLATPLAPHLKPLINLPPEPVTESPKDVIYTSFGTVARLAAQNGGAFGAPMSSPPQSPPIAPSSPEFVSSSSSSSSLSSSSTPSSPVSTPQSPISPPSPQLTEKPAKKGISIILDFQPVRAEINQSWGAGSQNYPLGADKVYQHTRAHVESLLKPTFNPAEDYPFELTQRRLALLQGWAQALDSLSPQNKAVVWSTCLLSPFFGHHIKTSFRRTLKLWSQDIQAHAASIRILFGAIGYLKNQDVLKNQFLCLASGHHIFRTFLFEELEEQEEDPPAGSSPDMMKSPSLIAAPLQLPPPAGHSAVDILAAAAILALYEEELDSQKTSPSASSSTKQTSTKRSSRDYVPPAQRAAKKHTKANVELKMAAAPFVNPLARLSAKRMTHPHESHHRATRVRT